MQQKYEEKTILEMWRAVIWHYNNTKQLLNIVKNNS